VGDCCAEHDHGDSPHQLYLPSAQDDWTATGTGSARSAEVWGDGGM